jgi:hypothetical protein
MVDRLMEERRKRDAGSERKKGEAKGEVAT